MNRVSEILIFSTKIPLLQPRTIDKVGNALCSVQIYQFGSRYWPKITVLKYYHGAYAVEQMLQSHSDLLSHLVHMVEGLFIVYVLIYRHPCP